MGRGLVRSDDRLWTPDHRAHVRCEVPHSLQGAALVAETESTPDDEDRMLDCIAERLERIKAKRPAQESLPDDRPPAIIDLCVFRSLLQFLNDRVDSIFGDVDFALIE